MDILLDMELHEKIVHITPKILKLIAEINEFKGSWHSQTKLAPDRLNSLKKIATIQSIASSTRIEGSQLTDNQVRLLLSTVDITSLKSPDEEEVAGHAELMNIIFENYHDLKLNENIIKQLHLIMLKYSSKDIRHRGEYKKINNNIEAFDVEGNSLGVLVQTASAFDTPFKMKKLLNWLNETLKNNEIHPLMTLSIFVVDFLAIHPFQDGNGRLSRALTTLLLLKLQYDYALYTSLERIIELNKEKYYLCLSRAQAEHPSSVIQLTKWIEFFLECLVMQKNELLTKLEQEQKINQLAPLSAKILLALQEHGRLAVSQIAVLVSANRNTVKAHVFQLVKEHKIQKIGSGKGTIYFL